MILDELRDWHAIRAGWEMRCGQWRRDCPERREYKYHPSHPFPATLDAADASMPKGVMWERYNDKWEACGTIKVYEVWCYDTGDKIRDLYELSKLAWEQEAAR